MNIQEKFRNGCALALGGGGGKGSYHIGVWKALAELGIFQNIEAFSGTSVGALNAVLFAVGDYENAEKIWLNIKESDLLPKSDKDTAGLFHREGLAEIIKNVPLSKLRNSKPVYVNVFCVDDRKTHSVRINDMNEGEIVNYLLASSAIPIVYPPVEINGKNYYDGGFIRMGNTPAEILYRNGHKNIIVSSLNPSFDINRIRSGSVLTDLNRFIDSIKDFVNARDKKLLAKLFESTGYIDLEQNFSDADFTVLKPAGHKGYMIPAVLDFSRLGILRRMIEGYVDTYKTLTGQDLSYMKDDFAEYDEAAINTELRGKMLSMFRSQQELEKFVLTAHFGKPNIEMPTMGGKVWYKDVAEVFGWKLQQHMIIPTHYRLLDRNGVRKAWTMDPDEFLKALDAYAENEENTLSECSENGLAVLKNE